MPYVKNVWVNGDTSKPLDDTRLNHNEDGTFLAMATAESAAATALAASNVAAAAQVAADLDADTAALVGDVGTATGTALSATIDEEIETQATTPGSPLVNAIESRIAASGGGVVFIDHGDNASAPRLNGGGETFTAPAIWRGTVAPVNAIPGDMVLIGEADAVPVLVWSDSASVDGSLGSTETGSLPWSVSGTGYVAAKSGGRFVFTAATSGLGSMFVDDGLTDCEFVVTIADAGAGAEATLWLRWQSSSTNVSLNYAGTSDPTYRVTRRISSTQTVIQDLTGFVMTDGDVVRCVTKADGTLIVTINDVEAFNGNEATAASATRRGFGVRTTTGATTVAFDDAAVYTLVD